MGNTRNMDTLKLKLNEILPYVGEYGRFQRLLIVMLFMINIPTYTQVMIVYFAVLPPEWRCAFNSTICTFNNTRAPHDESKCNMSRTDWYSIEPKGFSLVTQFDIYCHDEWLLHLTTSSFFVGWVLGAIILGWAADIYGRKVVLFLSLVLVLFTGIIVSFMPNIYLVIICRLILGFFFPGVFIPTFVLISELLGEKYREGAGLYIFCVIPFSWSFLALKAYLTTNWKVLSLISSAPYLFVLLFYKFIPESVQWLESFDKRDELMDVFRSIASWNKKDFPENIELLSSTSASTQKANPTEIFRTRRISLQSFTLIVLWTVINMVYYGLQLAADELGGSVYRDFFILAIVSLPAIFLSIFLCKRIGKKKTVLSCAFGAGASCMAVAFIQHTSLDIARVILGLVGKLFITVAYAVVHTWSAILYPVTLRSQAVGIFTACGRIGATASPWIVKGLLPLAEWLPFFVMALPLLIGVVISIWLPETTVSDEKGGKEANDMLLRDSSDTKA